MVKMVFESQRDFNRYMDGYMDKLAKNRTPKSPLFARKPKVEKVRIDKAISLEDKELQEVVEPRKEKEKKKSLMQKLMFFAGDIAKQEKEAKKELSKDKGMTEEEFDKIFELDDEEIKPRQQAVPQRPVQPGYSQPFYPRPQQQAPVRRPMGPISNGVPLSNLRQPSQGMRQPEVREVEQNFPYNPNAEKDIKYLVGLVNSLLNKLDSSKRQDFYRSSEYRIFESVRKKY
jgi:hypothetical protein